MNVRAGGVVFSLVLGLGLTASPAFADDPPATVEGDKTNKIEEGGEAKAGEKEAEGEKSEEKSGFGFTAEVAGASSYVWRGGRISTGNFQPVLQPSIEGEYAGLGPGTLKAGVWMNRALTSDLGVEDSPWEFDVSASYTLMLSLVKLELGYVTYLYPGADPVDAQHEFSAVGKFDFGIPVVPYAGVYVDPIRLRGLYGMVGVTNTLSLLDEALEIETALNGGVSTYDGVPFGLQDITLSSKGEYSFGDTGLYASLTLAVAYAGRAEAGDDMFLPYALLAVGYSL